MPRCPLDGKPRPRRSRNTRAGHHRSPQKVFEGTPTGSNTRVTLPGETCEDGGKPRPQPERRRSGLRWLDDCPHRRPRPALTIRSRDALRVQLGGDGSPRAPLFAQFQYLVQHAEAPVLRRDERLQAGVGPLVALEAEVLAQQDECAAHAVTGNEHRRGGGAGPRKSVFGGGRHAQTLPKRPRSSWYRR